MRPAADKAQDARPSPSGSNYKKNASQAVRHAQARVAPTPNRDLYEDVWEDFVRRPRRAPRLKNMASLK